MSARIVLLASDDFEDADLMEAVLDKTRLALEQDTLPPLFLKTRNGGGVEAIARAWWRLKRLHIEPSIRHPNKYVVMNSLIAEFPDAVLLFGTSRFITSAAERCARNNITPVHVTG